MKIRRPETKKARIEIIPMIDAIFFLLVFFMMTSLQMVQLNSHKVELPESSAARRAADESSKVVVSVSKEGEYFVDQIQVGEAQILPLLAQKVQQNPNVTVIINCDRAQQVGKFSRVFDLVKQANAADVMVATTPKSVGALAAPAP